MIEVLTCVDSIKSQMHVVMSMVITRKYYEITYNGDKHEAYVDVYKKWENFVIKEEDFNYKVEV